MYIDKKTISYVRFFLLQMLGSDRIILIGGPSFSNRQTRAMKAQVSPSQSSIDISKPPSTQQFGNSGGL